MSIIYEALKKVQTQMHPAAASETEQAQPIVVDIKPETKPAARTQTSGELENRSLFRFIMPFAIVIFTGIVWLIGTLVYYSDPIQQWLRTAEPAPAIYAPPVPGSFPIPTAMAPAVAEPPQAAPVPEPVQAAAVAVPQIAPEAQAPPLQSAPAVAAAPTQASGIAETPFHVQGIMTQNGQSVMLVNDRIYEPGDAIDGVKILAITANSITIMQDGKEETILMRR